jgi:hypothetical protein
MSRRRRPLGEEHDVGSPRYDSFLLISGRERNWANASTLKPNSRTKSSEPIRESGLRRTTGRD